MGPCCSAQISKENEDLMKEIIRNLKISKFSYQDLKAKLVSLSVKKATLTKESIKSDFEKIFLEKDAIKNKYICYHLKFYEEFENLLHPEINIFEIILFAYPLLIKQSKKVYEEFVEILTNVHGEFYSANKLHSIFMKIFEFYSYKITKIIYLESNNGELKENAFSMNKNFFTFENIKKAVDKILKEFHSDKMDDFRICSDDICDCLKDKSVFGFEEIRNCIIKEH